MNEKKELTADEIIELYTNVEFVESDNQLSTDEILKMYETVDDNLEKMKNKKAAESFNKTKVLTVKKRTRKKSKNYLN